MSSFMFGEAPQTWEGLHKVLVGLIRKLISKRGLNSVLPSLVRSSKAALYTSKTTKQYLRFSVENSHRNSFYSIYCKNS